MRRIAIVSAVIVIVLAAGFFHFNRERPYDSAFDTSVATPAYRDNAPVVLFDEAHKNTHTATAAYKPFVDLIRHDGYSVKTTREPFTRQRLAGVSVLVSVLAQGSNPTNDSAAYADSEAGAVAEWVRGGGSLLLVTDHWPFGLAMRSLAKRVEVDLGGGFVEDAKYHDAERGESHLVFSKANGLLKEHPITQGVQQVMTFTGSSVQGPPGSVPFMVLSDSATERPAGPARIDSSGGDRRVVMEYGEPHPAGGRAQGLAFELGKGRVVVLGEAGMLRAQKGRSGLVGMNVPGYDNRKLALNIMHWLSGAAR